MSCFTYEHRGPAPAAAAVVPVPAGAGAGGATSSRWRPTCRPTRTAAGLPPPADPDPGFVALAHAWAAGEALADVLGDEDLSGGDFVRNVKTLHRPAPPDRRRGPEPGDRPGRPPGRRGAAPGRRRRSTSRRRPRLDDGGGDERRAAGARATRPVTVRKGEAWRRGRRALPPRRRGASRVRRRGAGRRRGRLERAEDPVPPLGLVGGDLCRTLGGRGDEPAPGSRAAAHPGAGRPGLGPGRRPPALVRGPPRRPAVVVAGAGRGGHERRVPRRVGRGAPRPTPTTAGSTSSTARRRCRWRDRWRARRRLPPAPTCRTRRSRVRGVPAVQVEFDRPDAGVARRRAGGGGPAPVGPGGARRARPAWCDRRAGAVERVEPRRAAPGSSTSRPAATATARSTTRRWAPATCGSGRWPRRSNHMDLWVTRGLPRPPLPHVPGCDVAGVVESVGAGVTHVAAGRRGRASTRRCPRSRRSSRSATTRRSVAGFQILGEHRWGGHADLVVVPGRNVVAEARRPQLGGVRRLPARHPHRLADAAPGPGHGRRVRADRGHRRRRRARRRWRWPAAGRRGATPRHATRPSGTRGARAGGGRRPSTRRRTGR